MNIFASFACPELSARYLDDQRIVKMILESCQLLSTASALVGHWRPGMTKPTHKLHPCLLWVAEARSNWDWLWAHAHAMDEERQRRFGHRNPHKTLVSLRKAKANQVRLWLPYGATSHVNCARNKTLGVDFTWVPNTHLAYRKYLAARWAAQDKRPAICTVP